MIVTLIYLDKINTIILPKKIQGQYYLGPDNNKELIIIEGYSNWFIKSSKKYSILDSKDNVISEVKLKPNSIIKLMIQDELALIFIEPLTKERLQYKKYEINEDIELTVGNAKAHDIYFDNDFVSTNHATITYKKKYWSIEDLGSTNKTFVNNKKIDKCDLEFGDVIYIMGLKIIVAYNILVINNPDSKVKVNNNSLKEIEKKEIKNTQILDDEDIKPVGNLFSRSPRLKKEIKHVQYNVELPPESKQNEEVPVLLKWGPSVTMGIASIISATTTIIKSVKEGFSTDLVSEIAMAISMLLGTILWPILTGVFDKKTAIKKEKKRQDEYHNYLNNLKNNIEEETKLQKSILRENYDTIDEYEDRILNIKRNLWERELYQSDFLRIRLGKGEENLDCKIEYPKKIFSRKDDKLIDEMYEVCESPKIITDVPITISLYKNYITGVIGNKKRIKDLAKGMIFELASLYSYDELKMVFIYDEDENPDLSFVKWLPHTFSDNKKFRFISTTREENKELSYYFNDIIKHSKEQVDKNTYYIIFALDKELSSNCDMLNSIYNEKNNIGFSVINFFEDLQDLPKECTSVIELDNDESLNNGKYGKITENDDVLSSTRIFKPDIYITANPYKLSKKLLNIKIDTNEDSIQLPNVYQYLEMYKVGNVEYLNSQNRWKNTDPSKSLSCPIGIDSKGEIFNLDIHEKFHGPNGIILGSNGSGKSELINTYILSMATNYHPDEVSFILINSSINVSINDIPHIVGRVDEINKSNVCRTIKVLENEIHKRENLFEKASALNETSNVDIYKYQNLYRNKKVKVAIPHLIVIIDELSEIESNYLSSIQELLNLEKKGRNVGIHFIVSTQKLGNILEEPLLNDFKFRICLKTQDKEEAKKLIDSNEIDSIKQTGRFKIKVGYNELNEIVQTAWSGSNYHEMDNYQNNIDSEITFIDKNHHILKEVKLKENYIKEDKILKQTNVISKYISDISIKENISKKELLLPPLSENMTLDELNKIYNIDYSEFNPLIGEYDDIKNSAKKPLTLDFENNGNILIFGNYGSGKTMFLDTLVYSIIISYNSNKVKLYLCDFNNESLSIFNEAPHVEDIILSNDKAKLNKLFETLEKELLERKQYINKTYPNIVVVISKYDEYHSLYPDTEDKLVALTQECNKYGIYFVITASSPNEVRFKLSQNFGQNYILKLDDENKKKELLGTQDNYEIASYKGRGLININKNIYEFQVAKITLEEKQYSFIKEICSKLNKSSKDSKGEK